MAVYPWKPNNQFSFCQHLTPSRPIEEDGACDKTLHDAPSLSLHTIAIFGFRSGNLG